MLHVLLIVALFMFSAGLMSFLVRKNLISMLIGTELMLNAVSLNFMAFNRYVATDPVVGQVVVLFIIGLAAAEAAIALSIILAVYRKRGDILVDDLHELKG